MTDSEVGWISNTKLILTVNNEFFLVNIDSTQLQTINCCLKYGRQHINMNLYATILEDCTQSNNKKNSLNVNTKQKFTHLKVSLVKS
jgi:allantoicase